jgi:hypothetical protein
VGESRSAKPSTEFGIHGAASGFWLPTAPLGFPGPHGAAPMAAATAPAADLAVRSHDVSARTGGVAGGLAGRLDASYREPKR